VTTADWALVISICSAIVSLAGFVWNVWSKFIYPKPRVQVSFSFMTVIQKNPPVEENVLGVSAINMGPVQVTFTALSLHIGEARSHPIALDCSIRCITIPRRPTTRSDRSEEGFRKS
jgi:hypothetical protein